MFTSTEVWPGKYNACAAYLQKFVVDSADQMQLFEIIQEAGAASRLREYFKDNEVLRDAMERFKQIVGGNDVFIPDDFEDYVFSESAEKQAREYVRGLMVRFNDLEDFVLTPMTLENSRQIVLANIIIRNRSIRVLESVLSMIAVNSDILGRRKEANRFRPVSVAEKRILLKR